MERGKDQVQVPQWHHFWTLAYEVNHEAREVTLGPKTHWDSEHTGTA